MPLAGAGAFETAQDSCRSSSESAVEGRRAHVRGLCQFVHAQLIGEVLSDQSKKYPAIISATPLAVPRNRPRVMFMARRWPKAALWSSPFDRSFQGASGGEPRSIEDPTQNVEDFRRVTDYLMTLPYVDGDRGGVLGICGGGGYAVNATMTERRIRALGTVTAANLCPTARQCVDDRASLVPCRLDFDYITGMSLILVLGRIVGVLLFPLSHGDDCQTSCSQRCCFREWH